MVITHALKEVAREKKNLFFRQVLILLSFLNFVIVRVSLTETEFSGYSSRLTGLYKEILSMPSSSSDVVSVQTTKTCIVSPSTL